MYLCAYFGLLVSLDLKWVDYLKMNCLDIATDLASVADPLLMMFRGSFSDFEYHEIHDDTNNRISKVEKIIDRICVRKQPELYKKFCDAVKKLKFDALYQKLMSYM